MGLALFLFFFKEPMIMVSEERIKTNLLLMDELDMWDEFTVKAINDEWTLRYYNHIMNLLNSQVDESIKWLDSEEARQLFYDEAEYQYGLFQSLEDEWDTILENKYDSIEALLQEVYNRGKAKGYAEMREHIRFTDTDKLALEFVTSYNFALIRRLDNDTREQIKNNITSAVLSGENPRSIAPEIRDTLGTRLEGSTFTPTQRAVMIARTEISRAQNTGILQSYVNEGYTEVKILTAEDNNVCYTCLTYAYEFNNEDNVTFASRGEEKVHNIKELIKGGMFPPFHPLCRCTYLSVWETKGKPSESPEVMYLVTESSNSKNGQKQTNAIQEFNKLKDDPHIEWSTGVIDFERKELVNERFIKYHFLDTDITIYQSELNKHVSVIDVLEYYKSLPEGLQSQCKTIVLSNQSIQKIINGEKKYVSGFTKSDSLDTITILNKQDINQKDVEKSLIHELSHTIDGKDYVYSNSEEYARIYNKCKQRLLDKKIYGERKAHISNYSRDFTNIALNGGKGKNRPYSEDFAECVVEYIVNPTHLFQMFPEKGDYINNILHKYSQEEIKKLKGQK